MKIFRTTLLGMLFFLLLSFSLFTRAQSLESELQTESIPIPILIYHRVVPKVLSIYDYTTEQVEEHLRYFKENGYTPITALQLIEKMGNPKGLPEKPIVLTFDDGHKSHYNKVFPLLKKYGYTATFFVYTDVIAEKSDKQLTWDELRIMQQEGMDIQSHTKSHPYLTQAKKNENIETYLKRLSSEIYDSKQIIETKLQSKVDLLAYPYGWYNKDIETMAVQAGYRGIFTVNWGVNLPTQNPFRIKRRVMENTMGIADLNRMLTAYQPTIEIVQPEDAGKLVQAPVIKFKIADSNIETIEIKVRSIADKITQDQDGIFTWSGLKELRPGYHMIVIKGFDKESQPFVGSWGFDYQK